MTGWCPNKNGTSEDSECHYDGYCSNCLYDREKERRCDTCKHEKDQWFNRCADCYGYELWEKKE